MDADIGRYLDGKKDEFAEDLRRLVEIDSVRTAPEEGMPFGSGGAKALAEAEKILASHGYKAVNYSNYAVDADLGPAPSLMLLAHLDVVAQGDGWTKAPFALTREGDTVYGRGVTDDKGPAVACIYAMDACRKVYGEPARGVRLVLGSGEETGSEDMNHYFSVRPKLEYTLSPDADYPLINIEKGRFAPLFRAEKDNSGAVTVASFSGGSTQNIVPSKASAVVAGIDEQTVRTFAGRTQRETGVEFSVSACGGSVKIRADGVSAHAAQPEKGKNAQTALIKLINALPLDGNETTAAFSALEKLFPYGETDGLGAGVKMSDDQSGSLTLNFGVLSFDGKIFNAGIDVRFPVCATEKTVKDEIRKKLAGAGFEYVGDPVQKPAHCVPEDSPLIKTLLRVYEEHTGEKGKCLAIGGGTYVHDIDGGVAFGVEFPGKDYRIHGADETADLNELILTAKMYADVIKELCY